LRCTQASIDIIRRANPSAKVVLTTSPVPLGRTFTGHDVIIANGYSKAVLRAVAADIVEKNRHVDYFPSYEMVMLSDPRSSWEDDQRHVDDARVGKVVQMFVDSYFPELAGKPTARTRYVEAKILSSQRRTEEALNEFMALRPLFAGDQAFLNDMCLAAESAGAVQLAVELHFELDRLENRSLARQVRLAQCFARLNQHEQALALAEASIGHAAAPLIKLDALIALNLPTGPQFARYVLGQLRRDGRSRPDWVYTRLERSFQSMQDEANAIAVRELRDARMPSAATK
jgi:hypothetical protein